MSRRPALTPDQQQQVRQRIAAGEGIRALAREFKVGDATIRRLSAHSAQVRNVAEQIAAAQDALAALPPPQQVLALSLAEKLRSISDNLAAAAMHGAATAHRLNALANSEVAKVDDADPLASLGALRDVGVLSKLANESASVALNLLAANKPTVERLNLPPPPTPSIDPTKLSPETLAELLAVLDASAAPRPSHPQEP